MTFDVATTWICSFILLHMLELVDTSSIVCGFIRYPISPDRLRAPSFLLGRTDEHDSSSASVVVSAVNGDNSNGRSLHLEHKDTFSLNHESHSSSTAPFSGDAFDILSALTARCLMESERCVDAIDKGSGGAHGSSGTNWIDDASAYELRHALNKIELKLSDQRYGIDKDEADMWIRWMKAVPEAMIVELSHEFRNNVSSSLVHNLQEVNSMEPSDILGRMGCRLILLPSGAVLKRSLHSPPAGGVAFGKLLYGGIRRFRLLPDLSSGGGRRNGLKSKRRTAERTAIKATADDSIPCWVQYGGAERTYEAVDMGPCAVLEIIMYPRGLFTDPNSLVVNGENGKDKDYEAHNNDMVLSHLRWNPKSMLSFENGKNADDVAKERKSGDYKVSANAAISLTGKERNDAFETNFASRLGGLRPQIEAIVRRVLDGRSIHSANDDALNDHSQTVMDAEELSLLGLTPVRGLLLYGPPGCGKTALAREISSALGARAPKIVAAPELLDRWVGGSERLVRELFREAEAELAACNGEATKSALHVIVIDEIDAVFRKRSVAEDSGEATRSSAVNQILAKLDGVNEISNVLLVGMTNRRELLDEALLRPGRLEVQVEIPYPDKEGRREILKIHFASLRDRGRLSRPLCMAIDGVDLGEGYNVDEEYSIGMRRSRTIKLNQVVSRILRRLPILRCQRQGVAFDLASDHVTGGYSGADIAGLVRCAGSIALANARSNGNGVDGLLITLEDVKEALMELKKQVNHKQQ